MLPFHLCFLVYDGISQKFLLDVLIEAVLGPLVFTLFGIPKSKLFELDIPRMDVLMLCTLLHPYIRMQNMPLINPGQSRTMTSFREFYIH